MSSVLEKLLKQYKRVNKYSHINKGYMNIDNGLTKNYRFYYRSGYEKNFAKYLNVLVRNKTISHFRHESIEVFFTGEKRGAVCWLLDFTSYNDTGDVLNIYEVKGKFMSKDATKIKRLKKYHPDLFKKLIYVAPKHCFNKVSKLGIASQNFIAIEDINKFFKNIK